MYAFLEGFTNINQKQQNKIFEGSQDYQIKHWISNMKEMAKKLIFAVDIIKLRDHKYKIVKRKRLNTLKNSK